MLVAPGPTYLLGALVWAAGWTAMVWLDGRLDLANLALLLVLAAAVATWWLPVPLSLAASAASVLAFNWLFVPPRGTFTVDLRQHALLLGAMLALSWIVAALMALLRRRSRQLARVAQQAEELRVVSEMLRDSTDPLAELGTLRDALQRHAGRPVAVLALKDALPKDDDMAQALCAGETDADRQAGLWHCLRQNRAMGPGTGHHDALPAWYLPLRGRGAAFGSAVISGVERDDPASRAHAQALCDQLGLALQRAAAAREQQRVREQAQAQAVRNALLAAIAHDHRTPLATITSAASSLHDQGDRMRPEQRQRLARTIVDEATRLARLTDNTLQLARLDAPDVTLRCDWESAEELVGGALRRARPRGAQRTLHARLEPGLPLLWCDAMLMSQLLDNLVDNALKYSPPDAPVELLVRRHGDSVVLAVRDRGRGIAPAWRERVFDVFHRGAEAVDAQAAARVARDRPGAGVGLAVCRAIARVHGGELRLRSRAHGGTSFECVLPIKAEPPQPAHEGPPP